MSQSVLIDGRLIGYRYGGIATYARQLASHTPPFARSMQIRIAGRRIPHTLSDMAVNVYTPPHHRLERYTLGMEVLAHRPALFHVTDYVHPIIPGIKSVATVHDLAFLNDPSLLTPDSYAYYSQILYTLPEADRVIAVSKSTRDRLLTHVHCDPDRIEVIPNGFDPSVFGHVQDNDVHRLSSIDPVLGSMIRDERPIVLAVGTLEPRKRYGILIEAFQNYFQEIERLAGTAPVLVISGQSGWLSNEIVNSLRALQRTGRAIWLRDIGNRELAAIYRTAALHVMSSADEGFGLPVLEAMASGTSSLVANAGALPDLVEDCGFVEDSVDPEQWAGKIGRILADSEVRERRGQRGIERASQYTWQETARKTVELYREVLND